MCVVQLIEHACNSFEFNLRFKIKNSIQNSKFKSWVQAYGVYGPPAEPRVSRMVFSSGGGCLVTVDLRPDAGVCGSIEQCLRFWDQVSAAKRQCTPAAGCSCRLRKRCMYVGHAFNGNTETIVYFDLQAEWLEQCCSWDMVAIRLKMPLQHLPYMLSAAPSKLPRKRSRDGLLQQTES